MSLDDHPLIVPQGYRIVTRFAWMPIVIAGSVFWLERYRVIQRQQHDPRYPTLKEWQWVDVGYFDEVMPVGKPVIEMGEF